ncbi:MAG: phospho-N-acetylmuramoyl-pentapeptide-transferase [Planctomycetota bacterium]|nr:phospho-N-acetylmuramoyl-pentapeptide-transferase [Planctomycetota bacterium]MDW8372722.1 phospho-N-acetylmuramoyl-pentapeptide-transferase [Planctomycetota bacterium]
MLPLVADWLGLPALAGAATRILAATMLAFLGMFVVMPPLIRWLRAQKLGESGAKGEGAALVDAMREGKKGTPTMGGLGIVACIGLATLLCADLSETRPWLLLLVLLGFAALGYSDDRVKMFRDARGMSSGSKLVLQVLLALGCGLGLWLVGQHDARTLLAGHAPAGFPYGFYEKELGGELYLVRLAIDQLAFPLIPVEHALALGWLLVPWVAFVTISCANAVNFTDGMDGLAAGTVFIAALAFAVIAYLVSRVDAADHLQALYVSGGQEVAVFCAAMAGACLGFLWFNAPPARVFMGDTGSQALGAGLGVAAAATKQELLFLLIGAVFVAEAGSVLIQKLVFKATKHRPQGGRRVFRCAPLHHHFQYLGWPETTIVVRFWIIAAICALLALVTLRLR